MPSKVMDDLNQVPAIIASLGHAIAESQKEFDVNYLHGIQSLASMAKSFSDGTPGVSADLLKHLLLTAAPPRYQFTETTLTVKLDLAQSTEMAVQAGIGFGFAGIVVNAGFSMGFAQDFRAGAEVKTQIHAILPQANETLFNKLLDRAKELTSVPLPAKAEMDAKVFDAMKDAAKAIGATPKLPDAPSPHG